MYGMVGSGGGGGGSTRSRDRSSTRRSKRSLNQYRQASFTITEKSSKNSKYPFNRSSSTSSVLHRPTGATTASNIYSGTSGTMNTIAEGNKNSNRSQEEARNAAGRRRGSFTRAKSEEKGRDLSIDSLQMEKGEKDSSKDEEIASSNSKNHSKSKHSRRRRSHHSFYWKFMMLIKQAWTGVKFGSESEEEEIEQELRHRPEDINSLCRNTHFTRTELQRFYRAFKDRCPTGVITEGAFKEMYCQMFPKGASASQYAHYVFLTLDRQGEGVINFEDLITLLSRLCRGSVADRLCWIFNLYDLNNDGYISREEMSEVVQAVYDLLGTQTTIPVDSQTVEQKVEFLFETFDTNKDDLISLDEFIDACSKDITLVHNLDAMANYL